MVTAGVMPVLVAMMGAAMLWAGSMNAADGTALLSPPASRQAALQATAPAPPQASGGRTVTLTIGYPPGAGPIAPLFVAQAEGFFARNRLNVSLAAVKPTAQIAAMERGELQVASVGGPELVNAALSGSPVVMVAVTSDYPAFSLYAAKDITRMEDLSGKTIGVTAAGTSSETTAKLFLTHFGLLGQVRIVPTGGSNAATLAALEKGVVTGAILAPPATAQAAKAGFVELINGIKLGVPFTLNGMVVTRSYLQQHRDAVERFLRAYRDAWTFTAAPVNESAVLKVLASYTKAPPDVAKVSYDYLLPIWTGKKVPTVDPRGIATALRFSPNPKAKNATPDAFIDNSIIASLK